MSVILPLFPTDDLVQVKSG